MKSFRSLSEAEAWQMSHISRFWPPPETGDDCTDSSAKNQDYINQEDPPLINAVPVEVETQVSYTEFTNGDPVNGEQIVGSVMDTKAVLPDPQQKMWHSPLLSDEQRHVIELARQGKSLFFTGSAGSCYCYFTLRCLPTPCEPLGTGKSFTLRELIRALREDNAGRGVYVTASTGNSLFLQLSPRLSPRLTGFRYRRCQHWRRHTAFVCGDRHWKRTSIGVEAQSTWKPNGSRTLG